MSMKSLCTGIVTAFALALLAAPAQGEVVLRAVAAFPTTNANTQSFLRFIAKANKESHGYFKIKFIGGPEVTKPRQQPNALRNGLFDMMYGPGPYYLGLMPSIDFIHYTNPLKARYDGIYTMFRKAMKKKMDARFMGWFDSGWGLYLFTKNPPERTANGGISLHGLKLRSSPAYRNFIKALGGTPVVMRGGEIYTALQRGTIQGTGTSIQSVIADHLVGFLKYRIEPQMTHPGIFLVMSEAAWHKLPKKGQVLMDKICTKWEVESRNYWKTEIKKMEAQLASEGMKTIVLHGAAGRRYHALFLKGPWKRMEDNPRLGINLKKLQEIVHYNP